MKEFQQKKKIKKITHSKWVVAVLVFFSFVLLNSVFDLYQKKSQVIKIQKELKTEKRRTEEKRDAIIKEMEALDTARGQEALIREKYNVKSPGEGVIIVTDQVDKGEGVAVVKHDIWYSITHIFDVILRK